MNISQVSTQIAAALAISTTASCASTVESPLVGECLQTVNIYEIWHHPRGQSFIGKYLLASDLDSQEKENRTMVGIVDAGTRIQVVEVLKDYSGSRGAFLRIFVQIEEGSHQGIIADIPTCASFHPPEWIEKCTIDPGEISISPTKAVKCSS